ncbi:MAG TPA: MBOAT family O-acyltransferase [Rhodopila sp.]|nr:MBOAT family O-acyltransferase [Rhodopila sp.]
MNVPSWQFLTFALAGAAAFNLTRWPAWRQAVWLLLNLAFVCSFAPTLRALLPFALFIALGYAAQALARHGPRQAGIGASILVLAVFLWLKRYSFVPEILWLPAGYLTVGLSYVFFRVMHLVIEAGQGGTQPISLPAYLNYTLNFPAFVSGPIQRWEDYQASDNAPLGIRDLGIAAWRLMLGAFKVLIVSAALHAWQGQEIAGLTQVLPFPGRVLHGALIVVLYPLFLYANFSGYTDFVIGIARLFRLRLPENFDRPFGAPNFIEFWNRWHITLSQWLRSHVFNPLLLGWLRRGRRVRSKQYPGIIALFVTFFLVGAWHGQTTEFLFFGLLQGAGVAGNRLYQVWMTRKLTPSGYEQLGANPVYRALARGVTFTWFAFTLLWFWGTWSDVGLLASRLGVSGGALAALGTIATASAVLAIPDMMGSRGDRAARLIRSRYMRTAFSAAMVLVIAVGALVLNLSSPEIVYKQF